MRWPPALPGSERLPLGLLLGTVLLGTVLGAAVVGALWFATADDDRPAAVSAPTDQVTPPVTPPTTLPPASGDEVDGEDGEDVEGATAVPPGPSVPVPDGLPSGDPVTCPRATVTVSSSEELEARLEDARPGDSILLADGTYTGTFVTTARGTQEQPIFLCGGPGAVLDGDGIKGGYVLHLDGAAYWRLVGFTVRNGQKGVMLDATHGTVIQGLLVEGVGDEAIHLRSNSTHNAVLANTIRHTGLRRDKFGEGVYVGSATSNWPEHSDGEPDRSDRNLVQGNDISATAAESIDVKEGTTGGAVIGNTFDGAAMTGGDSWIDVKGNEWLIAGNSGRHTPKDGFQTHRILEGWGSRNVFRGNVADAHPDGQHFYIHDPDVTDNTVFCDNDTVDGVPLRSTIPCTEG